MRTANLANQALRESEVGQVWEEKLSGATGTLLLKPYRTFRVRGGAGTTVTIDGCLAMTMAAGEIAVFNAGSGTPGSAPADSNATVVSVVIAVAAAWVQVGRDNVRQN
jgi:hypothetical protein